MQYIYQHNSRKLVSAGDAVRVGQVLGTVGSTGSSTGPHVHFEMIRNGQHMNPAIAGYANGGLIKKQQLAMVGEGNHEEVIIPTGDPRKRTNAMKLLALAGRKLGVDGGNGGSVGAGGMPRGGGVRHYTNDLLDAILQHS